MTLARRLFTFFATAAVAVVAAAAPAGADPTTGGANNVVQVSATVDGAIESRAGTKVTPAPGPAVSSSNIALAQSVGCTACFSTAVAVQVVFVRDPSVFTPANAAVAVNAGCSSCGSFAYAWQYFVQNDGPVHLSPEGHQRVAALRQEISDTAASIVPDSLAADQALQAKLDALTAELRSVVDTELVLAGVDATGTAERHVDAAPGL